MLIDRDENRRKGLRTALRVAGLAGVVALGMGSAEGAPSNENQAVDDTVRNVQTQPTGGCWNWRFWGPPAPVAMAHDALHRLRNAVDNSARSAARRWVS